MADNDFRVRRPNQDGGTPASDTLAQGEAVRAQVSEGASAPQFSEGGAVGGTFPMTGQIPPAFQQALNAARAANDPNFQPQQPKQGFGQMSPNAQMSASGVGQSPAFTNTQQNLSSSGHLRELLETLKGNNATYEEIQLPSKGRFYNGEDGPADGVVAIRPMTGEEEQILATPRFVRKGQAINMIFQKCLRENYRPENLLTVDRTYLLIYLRGISYSTNYDVEIKCPECEKKFSTSIDLSSLYVEACPDDYGPILQDVLPTTKLPFRYKLSTGKDEQEIQDHRDRRIKAFGDASADDTLLYRTAVLLVDIDGITNKNELQILLKSLPINDVAYIRNCITEPPFGVDTNIEIVCPSCLQEFEMDLPLEANFFFPRRKKGKTQA